MPPSDASSALDVTQYKVTQRDATEPPFRTPSGQPRAGLTSTRDRRAPVQLVRQIRFRHRLAELHPPRGSGTRGRKDRPHPRHEADRGAIQVGQLPPGTRLPGRPGSERTPLLHQLGRVALHPGRQAGSRRLWPVQSSCRRQRLLHAATATSSSTTANACATWRPDRRPAVPPPSRPRSAGGCFWGMEDILRGIPGVLETESATPAARPSIPR